MAKSLRYFNRGDPETPPPKYRRCRKCGEEKLLTDFLRRPHCRFGYGGTCRACFNAGIDQKKAAARVKAWREKNPARYKAYNKKRYKRYTATEEQRRQINLKNRERYWANLTAERKAGRERMAKHRIKKGQKPRERVNFDDGRICPSCKVKKPWSDYIPCAHKNYVDGKHVPGYCRPCRAEKHKKQWEKTKADPRYVAMRARAYSRYMEKNAAHKARRNNAFYHRHREKILEAERAKVRNLEDSYLKDLIRREGVKTIPKTLIQVTRAQVRAKRVMREYRRTQNVT